MKIAIGGDHAGYKYKKKLVSWLKEQGHEVHDKGTYSDDSVDYPDYVHPVATMVEKEEVDYGILLCGSGNGVCMTANKHQGIRAGLAWQNDLARLAREHNDANILCLPARYISFEMAKDMVEIFLNTDFEGGRHQRRVSKISQC